MKFRKLLALALTGVTLLSTVPVHAQTTNSIGYTNFLFPEDGNNYFINAEHKFLGNTWIDAYDEETDTHYEYITDVVNQEVNLPTKTWVSFDVTSLVHDVKLHDLHKENRDWEAVKGLIEKHQDDTFTDETFLPIFADYVDSKPSETATVTFTQDGKQLAKFTLNKNVLADNKHFSFYNKSTSPVKVTVDTDSWFAMDLGYTAHKANKKYITDSNWTFSIQPEKTYIAKLTKDEIRDEGARSYKGIISYISIDGKPATIKVYQKGKLIQTKTVKSNTSFATKKIRKGKYTIKVSTKSSGYNLLATDRYTHYSINKGKKSSIKMTKEILACGNYYDAPGKSLLINVVPTKGFLYYGGTDGLSNGVKAYSPVFDIDTVRTGDGTAAGKNSNGYSVAVHGESLGNLNFDRLSW